MKRDKALLQIANCSATLKARGAASAYLFGSTVRNEATASSDLDIFIDLERWPEESEHG
jgi:uncharacterized protein